MCEWGEGKWYLVSCRPSQDPLELPRATHQPFLCHQVMRVIELPPPGNLSDLGPHIFISA